MFEWWMLEKIIPSQINELETDLQIKSVDTEQVLLTRGDTFFVVEGPDLFHVWEFDHVFSFETFYQVLGYLFVNAFRARKYATSSETRTWKPVDLMASCLVYQWKDEDVIDAPLPPPWHLNNTNNLIRDQQEQIQTLSEETMQVLWRYRIADGLYVAWDPHGLGKVTVILPDQVQTLQDYLHRAFPNLDESEIQQRREVLLDDRFYEERIFEEEWVSQFLQVVQESLFLSELDLVKLTYLGYVAVTKAREDVRYTELAATFLNLCNQLDTEVVRMVASKVQSRVDFTPLLEDFLRMSDTNRAFEILIQYVDLEKALELFNKQLGAEKAFELFNKQLGAEKAFELSSQQLGAEKALRLLVTHIGKQRALELLERITEEDE